MPECLVCGLQDFEERDGLYFCTTCQTQTQDLFVEEDEFEQADTGQAIVDHRLQIKQKTEKAAKPEEYKGRPWTIYEAYQIILKHQVQALIRLGADEQLKDIVFRLWAVYLSKLKVAFTDDEHLYPPMLSKHVRHREKYVGDVGDTMAPSRRLVRHHKRHNVNKISPVCPPIFEGVEFYEGDDPTQKSDPEDELYTSEEEEEREDDGEVENEEEGAVGGEHDDDDFEHPRRRKNVQKKSTMLRLMTSRLEWVSLPKLLSLCYLGLLYADSCTTAVDIVRLVEQGDIPYVEVTTLLPEEFQYSSFDPQLFIAQIPKPHALRYLTGNMANFLGITRLPPVSVSQLISRYIVQLDLPGEFHGLVISLMSQHPPQCQFTIRSQGEAASVPFFDALAMAHIVMTLKLYLGLDDSTEKKLSAYSEVMMELTENKHQLFVFKDWQHHITRKLSPDKEKITLFSPVDMSKVKDTDQVLESYYKSNHHLRRPGRYYVGKNFAKRGKNSRYNQTVKEDIAQPFKLAAEKMEKASKSCSNEHQDQDDIEMKDDDKTEKIEKRKFVFSSVRHITHPDTFIEDLDRHGLSEDTISSSCLETDSDSDSDDTIHGMEDLSIDSYHEPLSPRPKRHKSTAKEAVRRVYRKMQASKVQFSPEVQSKLNELKTKCVCASKNFIIYKKMLVKDRNFSIYAHRHRSYSWLVSLCSRIIRCAPYELDMFVLQLSKIHFSFSANMVGLLGPDIRRFRDKYYLHDLESDS